MFDYQMDDKMYTYVICCYGLNNIHTHADSFMVYYDHRIFKNEDEAINVILPTIREHCINVPIILKDEAVAYGFVLRWDKEKERYNVINYVGYAAYVRNQNIDCFRNSGLCHDFDIDQKQHQLNVFVRTLIQAMTINILSCYKGQGFCIAYWDIHTGRCSEYQDLALFSNYTGYDKTYTLEDDDSQDNEDIRYTISLSDYPDLMEISADFHTVYFNRKIIEPIFHFVFDRLSRF